MRSGLARFVLFTASAIEAMSPDAVATDNQNTLICRRLRHGAVQPCGGAPGSRHQAVPGPRVDEGEPGSN